MPKRLMTMLDLKDRAIRDWPKVGKVYVMVHSASKADFDRYDNPRKLICWGQRVEILETGILPFLAANHLPLSPSNDDPPVPLMRDRLLKPGYFFGREAWSFASDYGLWDVPDINYRNCSNYMLDVAALRREGIRIDMTSSERPNPNYQDWG